MDFFNQKQKFWIFKYSSESSIKNYVHSCLCLKLIARNLKEKKRKDINYILHSNYIIFPYDYVNDYLILEQQKSRYKDILEIKFNACI